MAETTHDALLRQTAAAEELLAYFQGQRADLQADIATAQAGYGALTSDLEAVVTARMSVSITFDPAAPAADLVDGGVFRTWAEFLTFVNALPELSYIECRLADGETLDITSQYHGHIYGPRRFYFRAVTGGLAAVDRPTLRSMCYDGVGFNQWYSIAWGRGGSFAFDGVNLSFAPELNGALSASTSNVFFNSQWAPISLINSKVSGAADNILVRAVGGAMVDLSLQNVELDGLIGVEHYNGSEGLALITERITTLSNGAVLHSPSFTLGTNLLKG
ncbi:hypothetical protein FHS89_001782 [Rubricella aquisinus]|uniref:Uncharacterized protein n=1 Tax=Rubricella aquisinus TaxID=2028108 RepID=A0A840WQ21_9RHOB|nr:hypothetical protein [Rubricella aquisinus]MBB5515762.1 hypothetical protein [Rubricella aquisinus]